MSSWLRDGWQGNWLMNWNDAFAQMSTSWIINQYHWCAAGKLAEMNAVCWSPSSFPVALITAWIFRMPARGSLFKQKSGRIKEPLFSLKLKILCQNNPNLCRFMSVLVNWDTKSALSFTDLFITRRKRVVSYKLPYLRSSANLEKDGERTNEGCHG